MTTAAKGKKKGAAAPARGTAPAKSRAQEEPKAPPPGAEQTYARSPAGFKAEQARERARQLEEEVRTLNLQAEQAEEEDRRAKMPRRAKTTGTVNRYVLLSGEHRERDGTNYVYSRDHETVVTSDAPLDEMFMNKFRKLDGETSPGRDFHDMIDRPTLADPPLAETRPHGIQTNFSVDTDKAAQERLRANREGADDEEEEEGPTPAADTEAEDEEEKDLGEDVTDQFEKATDAKAKVWKSGREYCITDDDDDKPLNKDEKLTSKEQVNKFLEELTK